MKEMYKNKALTIHHVCNKTQIRSCSRSLPPAHGCHSPPQLCSSLMLLCTLVPFALSLFSPLLCTFWLSHCLLAPCSPLPHGGAASCSWPAHLWTARGHTCHYSQAPECHRSKVRHRLRAGTRFPVGSVVPPRAFGELLRGARGRHWGSDHHGSSLPQGSCIHLGGLTHLMGISQLRAGSLSGGLATSGGSVTSGLGSGVTATSELSHLRGHGHLRAQHLKGRSHLRAQPPHRDQLTQCLATSAGSVTSGLGHLRGLRAQAPQRSQPS